MLINKSNLIFSGQNFVTEYLEPYYPIFFTLFKDKKMIILVICDNTKDNFLWESEKINFKISQELCKHR